MSNLYLDIFTEGTHANRPLTPPSGIPAAFYYETDTATLFLWNGSAWAQVVASQLRTAVGYPTGTTCRLGTAAALNPYAYDNGAAGIGATITFSANGTQTFDGVVGALNNGVLIKDEVGAKAPFNGPYIVTQAGDGSHPCILTRAPWFNTSAGAITAVYGLSEAGVTQPGTRWLFTNPGTVTFGTTPINFTQWTNPPLYIDNNSSLALLGFGYAGNSKLTFNGGWQVSGPNGDYALVVDGFTNGSPSLGLRIDCGASSSDIPFLILNSAENTTLFKILGDGQTIFGGLIASDLLFTDATFDIGKAGATRPRDGFFSRNLTIGGTTTHNGATVVNGTVAGVSYFQIANTSGLNGAWGRFTATSGTEFAIGTTSTGGNLQIRYANNGTDPAGGTTGFTYTSAGGIQVGAPTGADKGLGTGNFQGDVYKNGAAYTNPDYVFEHWHTGQVVKYAKRAGARDYKGHKSLAFVKAYARVNHHLPGFGDDKRHGLFSGGDAALAQIEHAYLHLFKLQTRLRLLEGAVAVLAVAQVIVWWRLW